MVDMHCHADHHQDDPVAAPLPGGGAARPSAARPPAGRTHHLVPAPATPPWLLTLAAGVLVLAVYFGLPTDGAAQAGLLAAVTCFAGISSWLAARRARGLSRIMWVAMAAAMLLTTCADLVYYSHPLLSAQPLPFPSFADVLWLAAYPCFVAALWALAARRRSRDTAGDVIDALIIATGAGTILWTTVLGPQLDRSSPLLAHAALLGYPIMDVVLFAFLVRLLVGARPNAAMTLLTASFVLLLVADTLDATRPAASGYRHGGVYEAILIVSHLLVAAAALHPTARLLPRAARSEAGRITRSRLLFLGGAVVVGPVTLAVRPDDRPLLAVLAVTSFLLVMARMVWLNLSLVSARHDVEGMTDELRHRAMHDALTGLPNRSLVLDRIEQLLARNRRNGTAGAALLVDLDEFKTVNDTLGHHVGDALLRGIAARLSSTLRGVDTIGRLGGDEFVVLIDDVELHCAPELVAERILEVVRGPFEIDDAGLPLVVTASVGIANAANGTAHDLLRYADLALYQAKAAGRNGYQVYDPDAHTELKRRYELELDLRGALAAGQYQLVYQPIYDLADFALVGFEALLRWRHPVHGVVPPAEFVPLLESSGHIVDVGRWALRHACAQMASWQAGTDRPLSISVNVSAHQLDRDSIVDHVRDALEESGLDPESLTIEITETALMRNVDATAARLRRLKQLGVHVAVDDFGTGYSSLAYLQQLPVDSLKIDRSFVEAITRSAEADAMIRTFVQLGKVLGLRTLAEGVETDQQIEHLRSQDIDAVQGFRLSGPVTPETVGRSLLPRPGAVRGS